MRKDKSSKVIGTVAGCGSLMMLVAMTTTNGSPAALTVAMLAMIAGAAVGVAVDDLYRIISKRKNKRNGQ